MVMHVGAGRGPGHLNRRQQGLSGSPAPVAGDAIALAIRDVTALNSVDGNGWTADVTFKGMAATGTFDQAGGKALSLTVERAGFTTIGAATTVTEVIKGSGALRKISPDHATKQIRASGSDAIVTAMLRRRLYSTDRIAAATIGAGAYTATTPSNASTIAAPDNNSTYAVPDPIYGWLLPPDQVMTADFRVEMVVTHCEGRLGQMVPCVEFRVRDVSTGTDQGISVKCSSPELSTLARQGPKVECYAGTIPISGLTQAGKYEVYAIIYPWVGPAFDTRVIGVTTMQDANQVGVKFRCDKTGQYGNPVAYVKNGAGAGTVGTSATPFSTIALAAMALKTHCTGKASPNARTNCGGSTIYLMEDSLGAGGSIAGFGGTFGSMMSDATLGTDDLLVLAADPAATGLVKFVTGAQKTPGRKTKFQLGEHFTIDNVAGTTADQIVLDGGGSGGSLLWIDGGSIAVTQPITLSNTLIFRETADKLIITNTTTDASTYIYNLSHLAYGNVIGRPWGNFVPSIFVGNRALGGFVLTDQNSGTSDRWVLGWNELYACTNTSRPGFVRTFTGFSFTSNVIESKNIGDPTLVLFGDNGSGTATNVLSFHNSFVGGRYNTMYTASGISAGGVIKTGDEAHNITNNTNSKTDIFRQGEGGSDMNTRTGNWPWINGVNRRGIITLDGDSQGNHAWGLGTWMGEIQPPRSLAAATVTFVDDKSGVGTGAGGGDYHLTGGSNDAYDVVEAGWGMLKYDLDGNLRLQDGTGAAGPYERP